MKHKGFSYEFTAKELVYLLFKKKICPRCGETMDKVKYFQTVKGRELNSKADPIFVPQVNIKQYHYRFACKGCGTQFTLTELAEGVNQ